MQTIPMGHLVLKREQEWDPPVGEQVDVFMHAV